MSGEVVENPAFLGNDLSRLRFDLEHSHNVLRRFEDVVTWLEEGCPGDLVERELGGYTIYRHGR